MSNKITEIVDEEQRFRDIRALHEYRRTKAANPFEAARFLAQNQSSVSRALAAEKSVPSNAKTIATLMDEERNTADIQTLDAYRKAKATNPFEAARIRNANQATISRAMAAEQAENNPGPDAA